MLQKTHAAYCYHRAEENRRMAANQINPQIRADYLDLEQRWLKLAVSYEFTDRLNQFSLWRNATAPT